MTMFVGKHFKLVILDEFGYAPFTLAPFTPFTFMDI